MSLQHLIKNILMYSFRISLKLVSGFSSSSHVVELKEVKVLFKLNYKGFNQSFFVLLYCIVVTRVNEFKASILY